MVLAFGNKSEAATGYCTLYGDTCGGLMPIGDLYKSQIFELARWRNQQSLALPEAVISRAPSAELSDGQKDEDSLPPYSVLDAILQMYLDEHKAQGEIAAQGYDKTTVAWVIGQYAKIGSNSEIHAGVSVREFCHVGKNAIIHDNTVIGADGFGFITKEGKHTKVPQVGNVVIEDDVEIGCNVGIDRATTGSTLIGKGTKIDNLVHIGHNCVLGENCLVVAQTGLAGSTIVGHNVTFAGQVGSKGHIKVGSNSVMAARTGLIADVPENSFYAGFPARSHQEWLRIKATEGRLPDMVKKLKLMERRLKALEEKNN